MLYLIGLGLSYESDITVRGLETIRKCKRVYLEAYTSILMAADLPSLEKFYGCEVLLADRELVESGSDEILAGADIDDIAFLVVGDPFGATTHTDLVIRARELGVKYEAIHNASVMNAVGACGLQLYNFGQTVSLVFFTDSWKPDSFYDKVLENRQLGLHTLLLLDIKVKEQSIENMARGRLIYEPPRYMSIETAAEQLLEIEEIRQEKCYGDDTPCVAISRLGSPKQTFKAATLRDLVDYESGEPLHSLIILGNRVHELETDFLLEFAGDAASKQKFADAVTADAENFKKPAPYITPAPGDDEDKIFDDFRRIRL
ncbi:diphthamide biosynthesis methyltransferase [Nadsonia fulvescens var. elongata DSM 6958]|uniref:diphthine methyl ester synthase n=1 Tax=Nadsonia fulvescens var. elongata DSM 6958 TaxID=857566 RepID=A0A1E3PEY5_9ASCO|nr:diphthamide biosynthesis methyltransferase [Nadsonia fulvescens var. elongata DSM 6958]